jgi:hypothetical protein
MENVVNNPTPAPAPAPVEHNNGIGFLIGVVLLIAFVAALLYFGIPALKNMGPIQIQANVPTPQVNIPSNINVTTGSPATK